MLTVDKCGGIELASFFRWQPVLPSYCCSVLGHFAAVDALHHEEQAEHFLHGHGLQMGGQWQLFRFGRPARASSVNDHGESSQVHHVLPIVN